jgi:chromate transporter
MSMATTPAYPTSQALQPVSLAQAFWYWLKLGFISFGGPAGQIAIMHHDLVEKKRWISDRRFLHALNYCMVLPGPEAQQLATYIGWLMHRTWGGVMAGGLFILPSFFILTGLAWVYMAYGHLPLVAGVLYGIKPAVVAIVIFAAYRIGLRTLRNKAMWGIAGLAFVEICVLGMPFPLIILIAGILGLWGGKACPAWFDMSLGHAEDQAEAEARPALIDDHTPPPAHTIFSWRVLWRVAAGGLLIWATAMAALTIHYGWHGAYTQMAWFFSKAALLTFGGAYAVLPYVYQGAVEHYHWLTAWQMMDGLALGETTPGPLIMVVTFVGFVGGWVAEAAGPYTQVVSAFLAASIVTFFTFLPSFVFILLGGPYVETTHGKLALTAPLTAITASIVSVIANLALFFAYHTVWPGGWGQGADGVALTLVGVSLMALIRFRGGVVAVIVLSGATGLGISVFMA